MLAVAVVWNLTGNLALPDELYLPANLLVAAGLLFAARRSGLSWDALGLARSRIGWGVLIGLLAAGLVALFFSLTLNLEAFDEFFENDDVRDDSSFDRWFVPSIRIPFGTAVFEEVLFRSALFGALLTRFDLKRSVVLSSVLFGLWHIVPAWEAASGSGVRIVVTIVLTVVGTTLAGVAFAGLRVWSRSVLAPIVAHTATNSFAYVSALIALDLL